MTFCCFCVLTYYLFCELQYCYFCLFVAMLFMIFVWSTIRGACAQACCYITNLGMLLLLDFEWLDSCREIRSVCRCLLLLKILRFLPHSEFGLVNVALLNFTAHSCRDNPSGPKRISVGLSLFLDGSKRINLKRGASDPLCYPDKLSTDFDGTNDFQFASV